jgi:transketolase
MIVDMLDTSTTAINKKLDELREKAGVAQCWHKLVGDTGKIVSIEHYGESADAKTLFREFGFTPEAVAAAAEQVVDN